MVETTRNRLRFATWGVAGALSAACLVLAVSDSYAQQQLRVPRGSVDVDWSVLDELDAGPVAQPRLAQPGARTPARRAPAAAAASTSTKSTHTTTTHARTSTRPAT